MPQNNPAFTTLMPRLPKVRDVMILGDYRTNEKVLVRGNVVNGTEQNSKVQFFITDSMNFDEEIGLQAISECSINKEFQIPIEAVGHYLVAKFTPMTENGERSKSRYAITEHVEAPGDPRSGQTVRGAAKAHNTAEQVAISGRINLYFAEDGTWKALGKDGDKFNSAIGLHVKHICEPFQEKWKQIPIQHKRLIQECFLEWFDIDYEYKDGAIREAVDRDAATAYRNWKNDLKVEFYKHSGLENPKAARAFLPESIRDPLHWQRCCDRYMSEEFKKKSKTASQNRGGQKYTSRHGRMPYARARAKKTNNETQQPQPAIDNCGDMHRKGGIWVNPEAERSYELTSVRS